MVTIHRAVARVSFKSFRTEEILEIPNSGGNHSSPFITENTEYVVAGTRFSIPMGGKDVPISSYKENFKGSISFHKSRSYGWSHEHCFPIENALDLIMI